VPCDKSYSGETAMTNLRRMAAVQGRLQCTTTFPSIITSEYRVLAGGARDEHSRVHRGRGANILEYTR
jgi:hypothetical protein